eukprot:1158127-Pelagomonas_calceolata.AAC.15
MVGVGLADGAGRDEIRGAQRRQVLESPLKLMDLVGRTLKALIMVSARGASIGQVLEWLEKLDLIGRELMALMAVGARDAMCKAVLS